MIKITYVTITYQAAKVLQRTLDSVLEQDYPEITHLIIDGASTDGTIEMVNDYIERSNASENGHKVLLMSEPDNGIYDAMNKGLRSLDGDYVCFLNAGDYLPAPDIASRINAQCSMFNVQWSMFNVQWSMVNLLPCFMAIRTSSMVRAVSCIIVVWRRRSILPGNPSVTACSSAIRPSMPVLTSPLQLPTTRNTAIQPMSTGASVS